MTLRTRLILWFAGTLSVILLIFCGVLIWLQPQVDIATLDGDLANDIVTVGGVLATEVEELGQPREAVAGMLNELQLPKRGLAVFDPAGALLGAQWNGLDAGDAGRPHARVGDAWTHHGPSGDARMRVGTATRGGRDVSHRDRGVAGRGGARRTDAAPQHSGGGPDRAAAGRASAARIAATRALRPVRRMADEAAAITAADPRRLTIINPRDEIGTLAHSLQRV